MPIHDSQTRDGLRARHRADLQAALPDHLARLGWDRRRIAAHQRDALRRLLATAIKGSPFHAHRLTGVNPDTIELSDLRRLPTMTKTEMMSEFDDLVTDPRLSRRLVETHLAGTGAEPTYLLDRYMVLASGGSSGERGVFVFGWQAAVDYILGLSRPGLARLAALGGTPPGGLTMAMVAAGSAVHATRALSAIFTGDPITATSIPVTLPTDEIVRRLNALQPQLLQGYPSALAVLAEELRTGRLHIAPMAITANSQQLTPETRARVEDAFGLPLADQFGSTEGVVGVSAPGDTAITLASDLAITELVDDDNQPVPPGEPSAKVLVTNLFNTVQPLIRYELTDHFTLRPDAAAHGHLNITADGRREEVLRWGPVLVHPLTISSVLVKTPEIIEYQVRQTATGVDVAAVVAGPIDPAGVAGQLTRALQDAGLATPEVAVAAVDRLDRDPQTGKAKRFITNAA
ncbi:MAG TPA: hypothetical protein VH912_03560 [Streptosporangiaceae bacterium]|jgi:phenylacetate-coenzyme A ligase PaaK-like adenylate-forming protein